MNNLPDRARIRQLALLILESHTDSLQVLDLLLKCEADIKLAKIKAIKYSGFVK